MRAAIRYSKLDYVETPTLFLEFHGTPSGVQEEVEMMQAITADHGGGGFQFAEQQSHGVDRAPSSRRYAH